jgi:hypothetical protein
MDLMVVRAMPNKNNCVLPNDASATKGQYKYEIYVSIILSVIYIIGIIRGSFSTFNISGEILWANPRPSSTRFCRHIRFQWLKETRKVAKAERDYSKEQIDKLEKLNFRGYTVTFTLLGAMINGKVRLILISNAVK